MTWTEIMMDEWEADLAPYCGRAALMNGAWRWSAKGPGKHRGGTSTSLETARLEASLALLEMHADLGRPLVALVRECANVLNAKEPRP
jgi:hypothetical protein